MKTKIIKSTTGKIFRRRFFILFIMTVSAILITYGFMRFCRVKSVTVHNHKEVEEAAILEKANIKTDKHLFSVNLQKIEAAVSQISPYIKSVQVKRKLPSEITIEIEEYTPYFCIQILDQYYLMSDELLLLEKITEAEAAAHPAALLKLPEINMDEDKFGIGKKIKFEEKENDAFVAETLKIVTNSFLKDCLTSLYLHEEANITALVSDRYTLRLGNKKELAKKIAMCEESIAYLRENMPSITGTLFAWSTKQVTFEMTGAN
ncbi:MAG: FtsQ-type POTRA domain-containing protein [Clostridia bacterium]|nr:FtsQ-type POTRA domain-containing protein [Clostridia bacterium]